ncbi:MAG: mechanosensitive ion channel family protein [Bacteroidota bacterium]
MFSFLFIKNQPELITNFVFGLQVWQWLGFLILLIGIVVFYIILSRLLGYVIDKILEKKNYEAIADVFIKPVAIALSLLIINLIIINLLMFFKLPQAVNKNVDLALNLLIPVFVTALVYKLADLFIEIVYKLSLKRSASLEQMLPLLRKGIKFAILVLGLLYVLEVLNINITPILAGVSIGGLALALAAQDTIKNLFGSLTILLDKPFLVGNWIIFEGSEGTVESIGMRSTRVRTFYDSLISIPNGKLADMKIDNMGMRRFRRFQTNLHFTYDSKSESIAEFIKEMKHFIGEHPKVRKDNYQVQVNEFSDKSIDVVLYSFLEVPDWGEELIARQEILLKAKETAERLGLRFAYPIKEFSKIPYS